MDVQVLSRKLVKPSSATPQILKIFQISSIDQHVPPSYTGLILYYLANEDETSIVSAKIAERKKKLEESLARILDLYYPLAGRFIDDKPIVDCNDEGVEVLEAKVSCKLCQVLRGEFNAKELNGLVCFHSESASKPLAYIQINVFDCGGMAIGMSFSHRLVDASTMSQFINGWSIASRVEIGMVHSPSFHLPSILLAREVAPKYTPVQKTEDGVNIVMERFVFNKEAITSLKDMARNGGESRTLADGSSKFSRVDVVTAVIWKSLIKANQTMSNGSLKPSMLIHTVNLRGKTSLPIPENSFGNLIALAIAKFLPVQCQQDVQYPCLVRLIHDAIRNTIADFANVTRSDDLYMKVTQAIVSAGEESDKFDSYVFTSWCGGFMFYEADFGWGKPIWMSRYHMPVELISLVSTKEGNGIEAWLSLDERTMLLLRQDPNIVAFAS